MTRFEGNEAADLDTTEITGQIVTVFDAPADKAPAYVQLDCGFTSHLFVDRAHAKPPGHR